MRHFNLAGSTPSGPEIEQYDLTPIGVEIQLPVLQVGAYELRCLIVQERSGRYRGLRSAHPNTEAQKQLYYK
jgi:hypothetical protein